MGFSFDSLSFPSPQAPSSSSSSWDSFWGAAGQIGSAALGYLSAKDTAKAQRDIAKQRGGMGGNDLLLNYLLQQNQPLQPARVQVPFTQQPSGQLPIFSTGGSQVAAPYVTQPQVQNAAWYNEPLINQLMPGAGSAVAARPAFASGGGIINAPQVFTQTQMGYRGKNFFAVANPQTGNLKWYRSAGRPILWSADLRACKRVNKVAARARRASPRKRVARRK
jgi:hypothetical protein